MEIEAKPASEPKATRAEILKAAAALAGRCDGAVALDGAGYNAIDSPVAKSILQARVQTDRQLRTLWSMLGKYKAQLASLGVDYGTLVPPPLPPRGSNGQFMIPANRIRLAWVDTKRGRRIAILFAYDPKMIEVLKGLRKTPASPPWFDGEKKVWLIPEDFSLMGSIVEGLLQEPGREVEVDPDILKVAENTKAAQKQAYEASKSAEAVIDVPTKLPLRPFQKAGVQYIEEHGGRALVADDMGSGKSVTTLGYLARHPEALPALIVCPQTLRANWYKETKRFTSYRPLIISSKTSLRAFLNLGLDAALGPQPGYDVVIMNYDLFETETPATWVRELCRGEKSVVPYLLEAGEYAINALNKAYSGSSDIEAKTRLLEVIREIGLKRKKNKRRFVKVCVNGVSLDEFLAHGFKSFIADESHYLKDMRTQRTMAADEISKKVGTVIALTGTPVMNRPIELWSQVRIVNPRVFPSWMEYGKRYCGGHVEKVQMKGAKRGVTQDVLNFSGASNLDELDRVLRTHVMIRRLKSEVLKELPEKIRMTIPMVIEKGMEEYRREAKPIIERLAQIKKERDEWKALLASMDRAARASYLAQHAAEATKKNTLAGVAVEEIEKLKLMAMAAKFDQASKFVLDAREQAGKAVVFMSHHATIDRMVEAAKKEGVKTEFIDGRVPGPDREPIKERFQEGDLELLVCGIRAASEGLTLTASHTVIFLEFDWNPGRHQQAEDRCHRMTQTQAVNIYYLMAMGTIEEKIVAMIDSKREVVNAALGESERTVEEMGILDALLEEIVK